MARGISDRIKMAAFRKRAIRNALPQLAMLYGARRHGLTSITESNLKYHFTTLGAFYLMRAFCEIHPPADFRDANKH